MNDISNGSSSKRYARQAIDGFIQAPRKEPLNRNRLQNQSSLQRKQSQAIGDGLRANLRGMSDISAKPKSKLGIAPAVARPVAVDDSLSKIRPAVKSGERPAKQKKEEKEPVAKISRKQQRMKKRRERKKWKTWAIRGGIASFLIVVLLGGFMITKGYLKLSQMFNGGGAAAAMESEVDPTKLKGEGDGRVNILLMGRGGAGHDGPDLTDTILIASVDPVNKQTALISIPRDMWVKSGSSSSKLNAVFANAKQKAQSRGSNTEQAEKAGIEATEAVIEKVLGINMHYYAVVDFAGFEKAVKTVGGVKINVPEELRDRTMAWENKGNPVLAKQGVQEMDSKQALMYVRSRHGSARGDFDRSERQRLFIMALKDEILSGNTFTNPVKITRLMDDFGDHIKTDFGMGDLRRLQSIAKDISGDKVKSIGLADPPNDYLVTGNFAGQSIVQPKEGLFDYGDIKEYIRKQLPDGYIIKEKAPIVVLNGTSTEGMATTIGDNLKTYSYNVTKVDNAPSQDYTKTTIVDLTGKNKYTKNYLERRFDTKVTRSLPEGIVIPEQERKGFVIIIGNNEITNR